MEIINKLDKDVTFRIVRPKDGSTMEEAMVVRNRDTGEKTIEVRDLPDAPAPLDMDQTVSAVSPRYTNDTARFDEYRHQKQDEYFDPNTPPIEHPDMTKWITDREEIAVDTQAHPGRTFFGGLGGLLGPNGRLGKKD